MFEIYAISEAARKGGVLDVDGAVLYTVNSRKVNPLKAAFVDICH
jgi:hypothetical protein